MHTIPGTHDDATITAASITRDEITKVERLIRAHLRTTPVIELEGEDFGLPGVSIILKLELLQHAGSFKTRGAFANLQLRAVPSAGVAAASGGNHGAAVAYAASVLGIPARIFVPRIASPAKIKRIQDFGAELVITGNCYDDALLASQEFVERSGALPIHAFDQRETILGQGTLALEFETQAPGLRTVLASVGGGGLIGGMAAWYGDAVEVAGVESENAPTLTEAFRAGQPVDAQAGGLAADSLAPRRVGEVAYAIARRYVNHVVLVSDDEIRAAQKVLWEKLRIVAEPGGSAAFAALLAHKCAAQPGDQVGVVISGGNTVAVNFDLQEMKSGK